MGLYWDDFWDNFATILGWFWDDFGKMFGRVLADYGAILGWFRDDLGTIEGWFWNILGWYWDIYWMIFGCFWDDYGMMMIFDDFGINPDQPGSTQINPNQPGSTRINLEQPGTTQLINTDLSSCQWPTITLNYSQGLHRLVIVLKRTKIWLKGLPQVGRRPTSD